MLLVEREIVVVRVTAIAHAGGVDAGGLADPLDPQSRRRAQRVVAAHHIVVMHLVVGVLQRRRIGRQVDQRVAALHSLLERRVIGDAGLDKGNASWQTALLGLYAVDADHAMLL